MRLFAYYIGHTFINSIKKILKTWVAFVLILMVCGGLVGFIAGTVASAIDKDPGYVFDDPNTDDPGNSDADGGSDSIHISVSFFSAFYELPTETKVELAVSALFFLMLVITLLNGKGLEEVFQPADVPILFSAPIKPQAVMLFRVFTTMGMQIIFSLIMAFQIPNLMMNAHLPAFGAVSLVIGWAMIAVLTTLIQVILYFISSISENFKKNMKLYVGIFFALIAAGFVFVMSQNNGDLIASAVIMFTGANSYWIPFWGWIRGFCMNAIGNHLPMAFLFLGICIAAFAALIVLIWNLKVDFYEDAVHAAERRAKKIEKANGNKNGLTERSKARSERIKRDEFNHGHGANVFFFKTMYNRFRFSWFHVITIPMVIYLGLAVFIIFLARMNHFTAYGFMAVSGAFCAVSFFHTLGNPLHDDVTKEFFMMIPCSARSKLFWSILGGVANTALDMVVPYIIAIVCLMPTVPEAILWFVFILTIDLYGTVVSTFITLSVSITLPEAVQKMILIMFIYFGIMPSVGVILGGILLHQVALFVGIGILMNLGVSFLFFMLTPLFLQNGRR